MKNFISNAVNNSKIFTYLKGPDDFQLLWTNSLFFRVIHFLFNIPCIILQKIYHRWEGVFANSFLIKIIKYLSTKLPLLIGLLLITTMAIPDHRWHNIYSVLLVALLSVAFLLKTMVAPGSKFNTASVDYAAVLFFLSIFLAGATSLFPKDSFSHLVYYFITFISVVIIISTIDSLEDLNMLIKLIAFGAFLTAVYGVYQWKFAGIAVNPSTTDLAMSHDLGGRVYSTMGNSNVYGELLVLTLPFFGAIILNEKSLFKKLMWAALLAPVILILFKTGSRSAWVAFAFSLIIFVFFWNKKLLPFLIILGAITLPFLPSSIYRRILTIFNPNDTSIGYRTKILDSALPMLKDYWVTGVGLGHKVSGAIFQSYKTFGLTNAAHTHNVFLQIWLEAGITAVVTLLLFVFRMIRNTLVAIREKKDPAANYILIASLSAVLGLLVMGLADHVWFFSRILFMFWIDVSIVLTSLKLINRH